MVNAAVYSRVVFWMKGFHFYCLEKTSAFDFVLAFVRNGNFPLKNQSKNTVSCELCKCLNAN